MRLTGFLLGVVVIAGCRTEHARTVASPTFECGSCHPAEVAVLARSNHARGQALATATSIPEGDVGGFHVRHDGGAVVVAWPEGSGVARYILGVAPLVQVAVETPGGKLQVPPIGWQPDAGWLRVPTLHGEAGDWRTPSFNWNGGCAACHATGFRAGVTSSGGFESTWTSLSVSCSACHGDAAGHRRWVERRPNVHAAGFAFSLRGRSTFSFEEDAGIARARDRLDDVQTGVCAACHSRRRAIVDDGVVSRFLFDRFEPALLTKGLYRADGRISDEVYETGSFLMSRMQRAGVRCSDCHEPHSGVLRAEGNALCSRCHQPAVFDTKAHHGETSACVSCHMPTVTLLGVDVRHDHSFRRPPTGAEPTTLAFEAMFDERADAPWRWRDVVSNAELSTFERASALPLHQGEWTAGDVAVLGRFIIDGDDWLRSGAAMALPSVPEPQRFRVGVRLLSDPRRAIRVQAGRAFTRIVELPAALRVELAEAERVNAFRGEAWLNSSALAPSPDEAMPLLQTGLQRDPTFVPLLINLVDLGRDAGLPQLETAAAQPGPWQTAAAYSLGLARWRSQDQEGARAAFERAATDGLGLHLISWCLAERTVRGAQAGWTALDAALARHPGKHALLDLALDWAASDHDAAREARVRTELRRWQRAPTVTSQ
ncbi:MAG: cytochrome c3 family protein [Myxococcales bacterium]|nr:cytochrome c3 family protein [Myxococcales bacterium]